MYSNIEFVCIVDHVNRSGTNFLIGETPVKNFPVFPDMSKIYNIIPGYKQVVVHTLGPSRFLKQYKQKQITSESVGLISPIWHYIGVNVYAKTTCTLIYKKELESVFIFKAVKLFANFYSELDIV